VPVECPIHVAILVPQILEDFVRLEKFLSVEFLQPTVKSLIHHSAIIANRAYKFKAKSLQKLRNTTEILCPSRLWNPYR